MTDSGSEPKRKGFSKAQQLRIWMRDSWHCRYCLEPLFFAPTLRLLHELRPNHSYYQGGGKAGEMLPLFRWGWASIDHIVPVTGGGTNDDDNLVAACWKCNLGKGNQDPLGFELKDVPEDLASLNWDGFASLYPTLLGEKDDWVRAILAIFAPG